MVEPLEQTSFGAVVMVAVGADVILLESGLKPVAEGVGVGIAIAGRTRGRRKRSILAVRLMACLYEELVLSLRVGWEWLT